MRYLTFSSPERGRYPVALLTKSLRPLDLAPFVKGIESDVVAYSLPLTKNPKGDEMQAYLAKLLPVLASLQVEYLLVTDGSYFKYLTKVARVDRFAGYVLPCKLKDYEYLNVISMPAPAQLMYDPAQQQPKVGQAHVALAAHQGGNYVPPGSTVINFAAYPSTVPEIAAWLEKLLDLPLAIDIETYSLKHYSAGIASITLCWSQHDGIAFCVDKDNSPEIAQQIRMLLKRFFEARVAKTLYHRAWFDVYVLIYQLFMDNLLDTAGLLYGLEIMLRNWEDTQLIRYLATNTCAGNKLGLKEAAQEYIGNYAIDVKDVDAVPASLLLEYNLHDGLATWYVYNKHWATVVQDQQEDIYRNKFQVWMHDIIQMQLTGLPMDMGKVAEGKAIMEADRNKAIDTIMASPCIVRMNDEIARRWACKRNQELKVKRVTPADCPDTFNINSGPQLQVLLHEIMGLPVLEHTDSGQPATGMDAIEGLIHHAKSPDQEAVLSALIAYKQVDKILTSFIPAFEEAALGPDGHHYLFGSFNLGGTLSGRLSSSDPNLQNLPATGSDYAKLVKQMFRAPKGKLLVGLDFNSLEDMISALTTRDPNKLKVYTDGFDGHCLRAYAYFGDRMVDIDPEDAKSINSIKKRYPKERQDSKGPTFAMTYQGTWRTLVTNCGFSEDMAKAIVVRYNEMYAASIQWVQSKLAEASKKGYVTLAFGLRLRTPMLKQTIANTRSTPYEAVAEGRSAGNALGQGWCMLNSRAAGEFMDLVRKSEWRLRIRPCAQIHDAQYYLVDDDIALLFWMNTHLVRCVQWQAAPEIAHPTVKLGGELSVFHPSWANELTIPNGASMDQIRSLAQDYVANGYKQ